MMIQQLQVWKDNKSTQYTKYRTDYLSSSFWFICFYCKRLHKHTCISLKLINGGNSMLNIHAIISISVKYEHMYKFKCNLLLTSEY